MDNENMNYYRIFHSVASCGSLSKAAKQLYISQPAISKTLQKLEESLNTKLFYRGAKGVTLTETGYALYHYTQKAFSAIEEGKHTIHQMNNYGDGQLRIGVSTTLCKYVLLPYLNDFIKQYPHIKITIECQSTFHTVSRLEDNEIDIGLIGRPNSHSRLIYDSIGMIEDIFIATNDYLDNLMLREPYTNTNELFENANVMLLEEENITRQYIDDYFTQNKIHTNQILEINNMDLLIDFAKTGLGIACVIKEFVHDLLQKKQIVQIPLTPSIKKRSIGYAYKKNAPVTDAMKHFIRYYHTLYALPPKCL